MRLLLASAGITNASILAALVDLLGKPIADSTALCIPTASYGMRDGGALAAWRFIDQTAIKITDEGVEVISEGHWRRFESASGSKGATA